MGWAGAVHAAWQAGRALAATPTAGSLSALVPGLVLVIQTVLVAVALSSSPLKLASPDMAHIAGAPLRRGAVVSVAFLGALPAPVLAAAALGDLGSIVLGGSSHHQAAGAVSAATLAVGSMALAWVLGLMRMAGTRRRWRLWPLPPLAAALLGWVVPAGALWPGRVLQAALTGRAPVWNPVLMGSLVALSAGLAAVGGRVNLTLVAGESGLFARMQALGPLAWTDPAAVRQIRLEEAQARRRARWALPAAQGFALLPARSALAYLRLPGRMLLWARDLLLAVLGCWVLLGHGTGLPWADWVFAAAAIPPRGVADVFAAETREPFLRQLLPFDGLTLLLGEAGIPALVVLLLSIAARIVRRPLSASIGSGVACATILVALRALCQAVAPQRAGGAAWRPPFVAVAAVCFGLMAVIAVPARAPGLALVVGAGLALALALALVAARE